MSTPTPNTPQPTGRKFREILESSWFSGITALASLISALASDDFWIRAPAILVMVIFTVVFVKGMWPRIRALMTWLTWKFVLGLITGMVVGAILFPVAFQPVFSFFMTLISPHVIIVRSRPTQGETIFNDQALFLQFSEPIPWPYYEFINVEISPNIPKYVWWEPTSNHQIINIKSARVFPDHFYPHFEDYATYPLKVSGPVLQEAVDFEFKAVPRP